MAVASNFACTNQWWKYPCMKVGVFVRVIFAMLRELLTFHDDRIMNMNKIECTVGASNALLSISFISLVLFFSSWVEAEQSLYGNGKEKAQVMQVKAQAVTGWNQRLGQPVAVLPIVGELNFNVNGVCGDKGAQPIMKETPLSAKLCTYADPEVYKIIFGYDVTPEIPAHQNIQLSDFPQVYSSAGDAKALPQAVESFWYEPANGAASKNYDVADWLRAKGNKT